MLAADIASVMTEALEVVQRLRRGDPGQPMGSVIGRRRPLLSVDEPR